MDLFSTSFYLFIYLAHHLYFYYPELGLPYETWYCGISVSESVLKNTDVKFSVSVFLSNGTEIFAICIFS